jgi:O-methyltransferase involved in polyketide biosynthesis
MRAADPRPIRNVSDTAAWVAVYRALESERPDALFHDPFARQMSGERGQQIVDALPFGRAMGWSIIVRTAVMDALILRCIDRGARTVLNLGAGLDTRAFRLPLPASLRWLDVDLPDVIAHRLDGLGAAVAACRHRHLSADGPLLVVTEGLLVYLTPEQVGELALQLRLEAGARWWLADLITPFLQKATGLAWHAQLAKAQAPFRFAPDDAPRFFEQLGWQEEEFHSTWDDSLQLGRPAPHGRLWDALARWSAPAAHRAMKRMSGVALLRTA